MSPKPRSPADAAASDAPSDGVLVAEILNGATARFGELVVRHDPSVRRVVCRGTRNPGTREAIIQETWCLAFQHLGTLTSPENVRGWVVRIAQRCLAARHRRAAGRALQALEADIPAHEDIPDPWVWDEVAMLQESFAEVLRLHYREGRTYAEIAGRLDLPATTIRGRIYQARRALRERLERIQRT